MRCWIQAAWSMFGHYNDVRMSVMASQITSLTIVYSTVYSGTDERKHQSSASLAFVRGIHRWPVNSPHKGPVTRKMFPFDDVIMAMAVRCMGIGYASVLRVLVAKRVMVCTTLHVISNDFALCRTITHKLTNKNAFTRNRPRLRVIVWLNA